MGIFPRGEKVMHGMQKNIPKKMVKYRLTLWTPESHSCSSWLSFSGLINDTTSDCKRSFAAKSLSSSVRPSLETRRNAPHKGIVLFPNKNEKKGPWLFSGGGYILRSYVVIIS